MDSVFKGSRNSCCLCENKTGLSENPQGHEKSACIGIIHHQTGSYWFFSDQSGPGGEINS